MLSRHVKHVKHVEHVEHVRPRLLRVLRALRVLRVATAWAVVVSVAGMLSFTGVSYASQEIAVGAQARVTNTGGDNILVRENAGTSFRQVAVVREGEFVLVLAGPQSDSKGNNWHKVEAARGTGWVSAEYLEGLGATATPGEQSGNQGASTAAGEQSSSEGAPAIKPGVYVKVANTGGDALRHRTSPSRNASTMHSIPASSSPMLVQEGPLTDNEGIAWYSVVAANTGGWAMARYLQVAPTPGGPQSQPQGAAPGTDSGTSGSTSRGGTSTDAESDNGAIATGQAVVATAMQYLGARYRFGGSSPSTGFDCSGFVYYVLNSAGVPIARDIFSQINSGPRVSRSDLRPGDLVFFSNTYKRGLSHSGIYVGNGKFINAENERTGVVISELWSSYWASHFTAAVRPANY